jgi:cystathionine beta-synthase
VEIAKELPEGSRMVVILPDSVRNYMTKFVDDAWMRQNGFTQPEWALHTIGDIYRKLHDQDLVTADISMQVGEVVELFRSRGISQLPITDDGRLAGILTESDLLRVLVDGRASNDSSVAEVMERNVATVRAHESAGQLPAIFERGEVALVVDEEHKPLGLLTKLDLIDYLTKQAQEQPAGA